MKMPFIHPARYMGKSEWQALAVCRSNPTSSSVTLERHLTPFGIPLPDFLEVSGYHKPVEIQIVAHQQRLKVESSQPESQP